MEQEQTRWSSQSKVRPESPIRSTSLDIVIPYKSPELTEAALAYAETLGQGLDIRLRLIEVHVVPYTLPLDRPFVNRDFLEENLRRVAEKSTAPISAELIFARDWDTGFRRALRLRSVVLFPIRKSWWCFHGKRMAERLRKHGHQVIWVEYDSKNLKPISVLHSTAVPPPQ